MRKFNKFSVAYVAVILVLILVVIVFVRQSGPKVQKIETIDDTNKLIVYTSHEPDVYEPVISEFEARTGIWVEVVSGGTNELLDRIEKEGKYPHADVMFGGGIDSLTAYEDYFESYESQYQEQISTSYVSENRKWTAFSKFPVVFIYNTKLVYEVGIPQKWDNLLDSYWQGKIAFADPKVSGSSYTALATMIQVIDKEHPQDVIEKFARNLDGSLLDGSSKVIDAVSMGEKLIGITSEDKALKYMENHQNIGIAYPIDGTTAVFDGTAIISGCPHEENAKLFVDFTVSEDVQWYIEDNCQRRSVKNDSKKEELPKEIISDLVWSVEEKDEIISTLEKYMRE